MTLGPTQPSRRPRATVAAGLAVGLLSITVSSARGPGQSDLQLPSGPLTFGMFSARFGSDGTFTLEGRDWPPFKGTWRAEASEIELRTPGEPGCDGPGRYRVGVQGTRLTVDLVSDACVPRRMILDRSTWRPRGESEAIPERRLVRTAAEPPPPLPEAGSAAGSWPSFRGPQGSGIAEGLRLPDTWNVKTGEHILWRTPIPGLAHSSPIVWGNRVFVTSAISSDPKATFRPGLYGDGDASADRSRHRWMVYALDKQSGMLLWERVAYEGEPLNKRHIKSTYASSTPATDGRIVVAWFGSQGVYAYDVNGKPAGPHSKVGMSYAPMLTRPRSTFHTRWASY
jgi:hypothetical protein